MPSLWMRIVSESSVVIETPKKNELTNSIDDSTHSDSNTAVKAESSTIVIETPTFELHIKNQNPQQEETIKVFIPRHTV